MSRYAHLAPHVRPFMLATPEERATFIQAPRWIGTEAAIEALNRLQSLLQRPRSLRTRGVMIVGPYANGKTVIAERFVLQHASTTTSRKIWVVQTREGAGLRHFYSGIIAGFGAPGGDRRSVPRLTEQVDALLRQLEPRVLIFDEFHNALRGRAKDIEAIFAFLRRLGREYDVSPVLIGEVAVYDHINATTEMATRFKTVAISRWRYDDAYLALLDTLEAAIPLAHPSDLSKESIARRIFKLSEGLIGETVNVVTEAALVAIGDGSERITLGAIDALEYVPASQRRRSSLRESLL